MTNNNSISIAESINKRLYKSLDKYLEDIGMILLLTTEEELELVRMIHGKTNESLAREKLTTCNLRFVVSIAKRYKDYGIPLEDLIAKGNIALEKAIDQFDETKGFRFLSYIVFHVRLAIERYVLLVKVLPELESHAKSLLQQLDYNVSILIDSEEDGDIVTKCKLLGLKRGNHDAEKSKESEPQDDKKDGLSSVTEPQNDIAVADEELKFEAFDKLGADLLDRGYSSIFGKCGKIARTILDGMEEPPKQLFDYFQDTEKKLLELLPTQNKARNELCALIHQYKSLASDILKKSKEELICQFYEIPYDKDNWVCKFTIENQRPPYIYLVYADMMDPEKNRGAYCWWNIEVLKKSKKEIASELGVTEETIRLDVAKEGRRKGLICKYFDSYPELKRNVICIDDLIDGDICDRLKSEQMDDVFDNMYQKSMFMAYLLDLHVEVRNRIDSIPEPIYLIKKEWTYNKPECIKILENGVFEDTYVDLSGIVDEELKNVVHEIAVKAYRCIPTDTIDRVLYLRNKADVKYDVCMVLRQRGDVMHIDEIYEEYHKLPFVKPLKDAEHLRTYLSRYDDCIEAMKDKSSRYALKEWNIDSRSRRDIMRDIIKNAGKPVCDRDLLEAVQKIYPDATIANIKNLLSNDPEARHENGYWVAKPQ